MNWTQEQDDILIAGKNKTYSELSKIVHHTRDAVQTRISILRKNGFVITPIGSEPRWSEDENSIFDKNVKNIILDELCKLLPNRSKASIKMKCVKKQTFPLKKDIKGKNSHHFNGYERLSGRRFSSYKKSARIRKIEFSVTPKYLWELLEKQDFKCVISGLPIDIMSNAGTTASPDRIDNSLGYVEGNIQWVRKEINLARHMLSVKDFINLCKVVAQKWS